MKNKTFSTITEEQARQYRKFGNQTHTPDSFWLAILVEEVGEVAETLIESERGAENHLVKELTQVAAVCCTWLDAIEERE